MPIVVLSLAVLALAALAIALWMRLRGVRREAVRLRGLIARRAEEMAALRRADGAVLEHLPDPLIVLDSERTVRR
ncbi:MAG: hypothetical protein WBQ75_04275, partial [Acetobacteraceae bacterium]